jgi:CHASE1-domain containing sensor protein
MNWQQALLMLFGALVIFAALVLLIDEFIQRRRARRTYRISPST